MQALLARLYVFSISVRDLIGPSGVVARMILQGGFFFDSLLLLQIISSGSSLTVTGISLWFLCFFFLATIFFVNEPI